VHESERGGDQGRTKLKGPAALPHSSFLQTLLSALRALGTPDSAVAALTTTLTALQDGGSGPPPGTAAPGAAAAPADALAALLAQCSLEASRRLAAAEAGGEVDGEEGEGDAGGAAPMADGDVECEACGGQVAAARLGTHRSLWCPGSLGPAPPPPPPR
jgi:hypothetical protein